MSNDIYSYIKENFGIEITDYKFKRDYIKNPLKEINHNDDLLKEDLYYMYGILNLTILNLSHIFNISSNRMQKILFTISKPFIRSPNTDSSIYKKYNIEISKLTRDYLIYPLQYTKNGRGSEIPSKEDLEYLYIEKNMTREDILKYFGISRDVFDGFMHRYGLRKPIEKLEENSKRMLIEKIGYDNPGKSPEVHKKMIRTNLKRHGYTYPFADKNKKERYKNKEYCEKVIKKIFESKKRNKTLTSSSEEDRIYKLLLLKFSKVLRQYRCELYPFACDFYIPEKDLFIEYQGTWLHGKEPYIGSKEQLEKINYWKEKGTALYLKAINTWTERDVLKRKIAKENKLNWIEFFSINEFCDWIDKII